MVTSGAMFYARRCFTAGNMLAASPRKVLRATIAFLGAACAAEQVLSLVSSGRVPCLPRPTTRPWGEAGIKSASGREAAPRLTTVNSSSRRSMFSMSDMWPKSAVATMTLRQSVRGNMLTMMITCSARRWPSRYLPAGYGHTHPSTTSFQMIVSLQYPAFISSRRV